MICIQKCHRYTQRHSGHLYRLRQIYHIHSVEYISRICSTYIPVEYIEHVMCILWNIYVGVLAERNSNAATVVRTLFYQCLPYRNPTVLSHRIDLLQKMRWERNGSQVRSPSKNPKPSERKPRACFRKIFMHDVFFEKVSGSWKRTWSENRFVPTAFVEEGQCSGTMRWDSLTSPHKHWLK